MPPWAIWWTLYIMIESGTTRPSLDLFDPASRLCSLSGRAEP